MADPDNRLPPDRPVAGSVLRSARPTRSVHHPSAASALGQVFATPDPFAALQGSKLHWWRRGNVPESLSVLKLGDLATDPFTGQPFEYTVAEGKYRLTSAGPRALAGDERAGKGRRPISVVPKP